MPLIVGTSLDENESEDHPKATDFGEVHSAHAPIYEVAAFGILGITTALYMLFW